MECDEIRKRMSAFVMKESCIAIGSDPVSAVLDADKARDFYATLISWRQNLNDVDETHYGIIYWLKCLHRLWGLPLIMLYDNGDSFQINEGPPILVGIEKFMRQESLLCIRLSKKFRHAEHVGWPLGFTEGNLKYKVRGAGVINFPLLAIETCYEKFDI